MKNSNSSKSRILIGATLLIILLSISFSCTKSSTNDMITGSKGGSAPGANEVWIQGMTFNPGSFRNFRSIFVFFIKTPLFYY